MRSAGVPERRAPAEKTSVLSWALFRGETTKERVMLDTFLPKAFAFVAIVKVELDQVFAWVTVRFRVNLRGNGLIARFYGGDIIYIR